MEISGFIINKIMTEAALPWDFYRSFLAVLDGGSLSAAARHLGLTQPTVGNHVEALEAGLGVPLFTRSPRGLVPTETARLLRPHAEAMAVAAEALRRQASAAAGAPSGVVRITASDVVGGAVLPADPGRAAPPGAGHQDRIIPVEPDRRPAAPGCGSGHPHGGADASGADRPPSRRYPPWPVRDGGLSGTGAASRPASPILPGTT